MLLILGQAALQVADVFPDGLEPRLVPLIARVCWGKAFRHDFQLPLQAASIRFESRQANMSLLGCFGQNLLEALRILAHLRELLHHDRFHQTSRDGLRRATVVAPLLSYRAYVIAIALAALGRVSGCHGRAARPAVKQPFQNRPRAVPLP